MGVYIFLFGKYTKEIPEIFLSPLRFIPVHSISLCFMLYNLLLFINICDFVASSMQVCELGCKK